MRTGVNREIAHSVRRALIVCAMAACGAGSLAAQAQQAQASSNNSSEAQPALAGSHHAKKAQLAQASGHHLRKVRLAQASSNQSNDPPQVAVPAGGNSSASPAQLQTVVVTGSLISRTTLETPSPVQVITSKDLVQSGYTDITQVLKQVTANGASNLNQSFSFAFAAGASGISLRGLTVGDTLVLIDSQRTVPYPLLDDNQRSFVDIASIPFMAIKSVQIDKNGASAVYGSDAIAGVVNVLLRDQFQGFQAVGEMGSASNKWDGTLEHFGFIGGQGDLASDGYNWYLSGEFRHQDQILASNRTGLWDNLNWNPWGGTYGGFTNLGVSPASNPFYPYPNSTTGYLVDPATGLVASYLPGCTALQQQQNRCTAIWPGAQLQPSTTRIQIIGKFTKQLSANWQLKTQISWFDSRAEQIDGYYAPSPNSNGTNYPSGLFNFAFGPGKPFTVVPSSQLTTPNIITLPPTNPQYPACTTESWCGSPLALVSAFPEAAPQQLTTNTNTYRLLVDATGNAWGWDIDAAAGAMYAKMEYKLYGQLQWGALQTALNNGYILGSPSGVSLFAPPEETEPTSDLDLVNVHGTRSLVDLPGGPVQLAVGAEWYQKTQNETAPPLAEAGIQSEAGGPVFVIGTERDTAVFGELEVKPVKQLELDGAGRYDHYQHFGGAATPQVGGKWTPIKYVAIRGTWGKGFRAPSAAEGQQSGELFGAGSYTDPVLCPHPSPGTGLAGPGDFPSQCGFPLQGFNAANPNLQNVKSTNWTAGIILQPIDQVSVSMDYYNIKINNDIISGFEAGGFASGYGTLIRGSPITLPYCPPSNTGGCTTAQLVNATTPIGTILAAQYPYINAGSTHTSGWDLDLKAHYDAGRFGNFSAEATWTHELTYQLTVAGVTYELAGTHGPSGISGDTGNPKDRAQLIASWTKGPWTIAPSVNFVGHFSITDPSSGIPTCATALGYFGRFANGVTPANQNFCTVGYWLETNVYVSYQLSDKFQVHGSVTNLFDKQPPVDIQTYGSGTYFYPYDAAFHQDGAVGRFITIGASYQF